MVPPRQAGCDRETRWPLLVSMQGVTPILCAPRTSVLLWQFVTSVVLEEVRTMATHSKTRRAVRRLRRLARRLREAELKKTRSSGMDKPR